VITRTTIRGVLAGLSEHPLALALVVVNFMFLGAGFYVLRAVASSNERWLALLASACKLEVTR
jgi:hypothetical protein